jgi:poly-gamma-glutamate synthesis protein (capsule biosynthesis protein)
MLKLFTDNDIGYVGMGENDELSRAILYIENNGVKVGIINVCEHEYTYAKQNSFGANPFNYLKTVEDVNKAKRNADYVVVIFHGGKEYCRYPSPRLMDACRLLAVAGANLVLCQHTHCISCYEEYNGCHILYGQGNYHFCKGKETPMPDCWNTGLLCKVTATKQEFKVEYYPTYVNDGVINLAEGDIANEIMAGLYNRNEELKNGKWIDGWKAFVKTVENIYRNAVEGSFKEGATDDDKEMFPHFYDCEAHQDVLHELYPSWHKKN